MEVVKPDAATAPADDLHATIRGAHSRGSVSPPIAATTAERGPVSPFAPNVVHEANQGVFERITKLFLAGQLLEKIDTIPVEMRPKTAASFRCCIYKDRAAIRYRVMAALGLRVEREEDECRTLASYAKEALERPREKLRGPALTVLEEACNHCMRQQYYVTDACQGCIARPCATNCPKKAIEHVNNRAVIDADACIKCGKCMQVCPYHAIINLPIPCVSACPVGAITALPDGGKHFDWNKCIYCGHCQRACPFGAVMDRSQLIEVLKAIKDPNTKAVAMVAPAAAGHFSNTPMWSILAALKKAGFDEVMEVSLGADTTTEEEAAEFVHKFGPGAPPQKLPFMTTSCCPAYINCIKKHIPEIEEAVSHTPSPMVFTAKLAKERWPGCVAVFIGPCVAKLQDAITCKYTDFALTFIETMGLIRGAGVTFENMPQPPAGYEQGSAEAKRFAITTGVASAVASITPQGEKFPELKPVIIDGLSQATVKKMKSFAKVPPPGNLVEVMVCEGGCVNGAGTIAPVVTATGRVKAAVAKSVHHPQANNPPIERKLVIIRNGAIVDN